MFLFSSFQDFHLLLLISIYYPLLAFLVSNLYSRLGSVLLNDCLILLKSKVIYPIMNALIADPS